ncbi:terminase large subunit domain-containing protein [Corynebacterium halotolerans]
MRLFAEKFLRVPKGKGAGGPMKLRPWQVDMASTLYGDELKTAVWVIPRGNGKSGIAAAIALHHVFMSGIEGARCIIVAQDERSAMRLLTTAKRMVQMNPELDSRCKIYSDRIEVPGSNSSIVALPGEAHRIEGEDATLAIIDEVGIVRKEAFAAAILSTGKDEFGKVLAIGTPSPARWREASPLWELVVEGRSNRDDPTFSLVEFGVDAKRPISDPETWREANPAYDDWLTEANVRNQLPPKTSELEFRRARLGQWSEQSSEPAFNAEKWEECGREGVMIPPGSRVVLAFDGSSSDDSTAIVVGSVSKVPHYQVGGLWEPSKEEAGYRVDQLEVMQRIRDLASVYDVQEIVADTHLWMYALTVLKEEGYPVHSFPQTPRRQTPATNDLRGAIHGGLLTHSGEKSLTSHVLRASLEEKSSGVKLVKPSEKQKIDLAVSLMMCHSRCTYLALPSHKRRKKVRGFK